MTLYGSVGGASSSSDTLELSWQPSKGSRITAVAKGESAPATDLYTQT